MNPKSKQLSQNEDVDALIQIATEIWPESVVQITDDLCWMVIVDGQPVAEISASPR